MNNEQLQKAKELERTLEGLATQKGVWEKSSRISELQVYISENNGSRTRSVSLDYVNYDVVKAIALDSINKKIATTKAEFDAL